MYNINVKRIFVITEIVHMNAGVSIKKEKVKELKSHNHEAWHPRSTSTSGAGSGASQARSLPITALVQLTFSHLNSYFVAKREQGADRLASDEQFTPYVDPHIQDRVVKAGSMEIVLYDRIQGRFHVKSRSGRIHHLNLNDKKCTCGKTLIYGFPCSHIIAACQHRCVDFLLFVQGYYTTHSYYDTWASLFYPIFNEDE